VSLLSINCLVADAIMMPAMTKLLETAMTRGLRTHTGLHMLDGQLEMMADFLIGDVSRT
jgi:shikimate dehydrogenase